MIDDVGIGWRMRPDSGSRFRPALLGAAATDDAYATRITAMHQSGWRTLGSASRIALPVGDPGDPESGNLPNPRLV